VDDEDGRGGCQAFPENGLHISILPLLMTPRDRERHLGAEFHELVFCVAREGGGDPPGFDREGRLEKIVREALARLLDVDRMVEGQLGAQGGELVAARAPGGAALPPAVRPSHAPSTALGNVPRMPHPRVITPSRVPSQRRPRRRYFLLTSP